ncbi:zinc-binding alcohol dehydrogenase family protein [Secundilactobacillus malefermentans]|uniref:Zinc-type alcohol dehydrogenase-like protein n=1 Tax=Secundilactobacillus malefermentans TaxID=176292 RepID=A0A4R5NR97_9LACO|nr:zinc-binding alcohol dehydrogenase family protein [Secundilactobacillus malefermentans]KRM57088.1 alcohol dehydrogenase [Secundilactobacillus malefermentans DSM 5705 = KCTC 3548]TDG79527.1 hypothetical protein C5L31_000869 [Secundilactobacillus malefermentans]
MTKMMKAVGFYEGLPVSDSKAFEDVQLEKPVATGKDLLVKVQSVSVNPVDTKTREATPKQATPKVIGFDAVGEVVGLGESVTKFKASDQVYYAGSIIRSGSNSEFQLVDERLVAAAPKKLTVNEAAAMPLVSLTAYELLFEKMGYTFGEGANTGKTILIINGAGGVGSIMTQLAKWSGLTVIATSSHGKFDWLRENGTDFPIDYRDDLVQSVSKLPVGLISGIAILHVPQPYLEAASELIAPFGHVATIVGANVELPVDVLKDKAASFDWEFMFAKSKYHFNEASQGQILADMASLFDSGKLHSTMTEIIANGINAKVMREAHKKVESGHMSGKLVVAGPFNAD